MPEAFDNDDKDNPSILKSCNNYKEVRIVLNHALTRMEIAKNYFLLNPDEPFTFIKFFKLFDGDKVRIKVRTLSELFLELEAKYKEEGRISYMDNFQNVRKSIANYQSKKDCTLQDVDYSFLTGYETYLKARGCAVATLMNYIGCIRTALIHAINKGYLEDSLYPFRRYSGQVGKFNFGKFKKQRKSRALSAGDSDKIKEFDPYEYPHLKWAHDIFTYSYYARGMNFKDIALLKITDIYNDEMTYGRSKTDGAQRKKITPPMRKVLDDMKSLSKGYYVFNILDQDVHVSPTQIYNRIKKVRKKYNKDLKEIAKLLDIDMKLTSYVSRHTYTMTLKRNDVPLEVISKNLGHADMKTTEYYLDAMSSEVGDKADEVL